MMLYVNSITRAVFVSLPKTLEVKNVLDLHAASESNKT